MTPIAKAAFTALGAVVSAVGSFRQASATEDQAALEAQREQARADAESAQREREAEDLHKRQIAAYSASGVRSREGTPLLLYADTIQELEEDLENINQNTLFAQASLKGRGAIGASKLRSEGVGTLISGGTKAATLLGGNSSSVSMTTTPVGGSPTNFATTV